MDWQQSLLLVLICFNICIDHLVQDVEGVLIKSVNDTNLNGLANSLKDINKSQNNNDSLETWFDNNSRKFNRDKGRIIHLASELK